MGVHSQDLCRCTHTLAQHYPHEGTNEIRCDFCPCEWFTDADAKPS